MLVAPRLRHPVCMYIPQKWAGSLMGWAVQWAVVGKERRARSRLGIRGMLDRGLEWSGCLLALRANGGGAWTEGK